MFELSSLHLKDLAIYTLIIIGALLLIRTLIRWYVTKIAPTKPTQARILKALIKPIIITLFLAAIAALLSYRLPDANPLISNLINSTILVFWTASIITISRQLVKIFINSVSKRHQNAADAIPMANSIVVSLILFTSVYLFFLIWGVNLTPLFALIGIIGTALSFAARDVVSNTLSGISIFMTQPFKVGDYIIISNDFQGKITEIGIQYTKLLSPNHTTLIIPNSTITTKPIENQTGGDTNYHFTLPLTVPDTTDLNTLKSDLYEAAKENKWLLPTPQPKLYVTSYEKDQINLTLIATIEDPTKTALVTHQLLKAIKLNEIPKANHLSDNTDSAVK